MFASSAMAVLLMAQPSAAQVQPQEDAATVTEVTVTGSRITRRDFVANSPIITAGEDVLESSGAATVDEVLTQLPQFSGARNSAEIITGNGQANLNLRGLGANRSLVLVDGRRMQPSSADGSIDVNTLPMFLVESVEVITGGASATYGSDAMAGVVNFKLKSFDSGVQADVQLGQSSRGDGLTADVNLVFGERFRDDRGHAMLLFNYASREEVLRSARPWFDLSMLTTNIPHTSINLAANAPTQAAVNAVFARYGAAPGSALATRPFGFNLDGTLFSAVGGGASVVNYRDPADPLVAVRGNTVFYNQGALWGLQAPLERYNVFGRTSLQLAPGFEVWGELNFSQYTAVRTLNSASAGGFGSTVSAPVTNPSIPADFRQILASRRSPNADFAIVSQLEEFGLRHEENSSTLYQVTVGANGEVESVGWKWDIHANYGRTDFVQVGGGGVSIAAMQRLLFAPDGGASLCGGGYNIFGRQPVSAACVNYMARTPKSSTEFEQRVVEANVSGDLFELPAGPLQFALGASYRENGYDFRPDDLIIAGDIIGYSASSPASGTISVSELFGELLVPVLADAPFVKSLNVNLAYRFSDYDTVGGVHTYRASADWSVNDWIFVRGGYSRAVRAPSLLDLYAAPLRAAGANIGDAVGPTGVPQFAGDPCDVRGATRVNAGANAAAVRALCLAQGVPSVDTFIGASGSGVFTLREGNRNLHEEKADTYSLGVVLKSPISAPLFSRLQLSVDYYNIEIQDAVGVLAISTSLARCFNQDNVSNPTFSPTNVFCQNVVRRPSDGFIVDALEPVVNQASIQTAGVDTQANWKVALGDLGLPENFGTLTLNSVVSYVDKFEVQTITGGLIQDLAGTNGNNALPETAAPKWKAMTSATIATGPFLASVTWRYIGEVSDVSAVANPATTTPGYSAFNYFDLFASWKLSDAVQLRGGVSNVGDQAPEYTRGELGRVDTKTYDAFGRRYYVGLRATF